MSDEVRIPAERTPLAAPQPTDPAFRISAHPDVRAAIERLDEARGEMAAAAVEMREAATAMREAASAVRESRDQGETIPR